MKMQWKIGQVEMQNPFILAPMAGVTDLPFRLLCKEQGAGLLCTEMVSAKAISFRNKNTISLMQIDPAEHPVSMQIFGSEPDLMAEVAKSIEEQPFDILDINMGCPVPKVVNNGEGSALLKNPDLIREIVTKVSHAVKKPVTAKIRIGFEGYPVDPVEIAKIIEDSGAAAVAVHGRTRQQYYAGEADWDTIHRIKEAVSIPVIGNGDVDSPEKAEALVKETGCDGIMIGRAVRGNPWIFREMNHYFTTGELLPRPSWDEIREMILRHARMQIELKGEFTGIREMRKHIAWYTSGMRHSAGLRRDSNLVSSYEELEKLLDHELENLSDSLKKENKTMAVWGASHQGFTLTATTHLKDSVSYIIDSAPFKQGRFAPGSGLPIVPPDYVTDHMVDAILIVAPGYTEEIAGNIRKWWGEQIRILTLRSEKVEELS